jgi:hypothetical protein
MQKRRDVGAQRRFTRRERAVEVEDEELLDGVPPSLVDFASGPGTTLNEH